MKTRERTRTLTGHSVAEGVSVGKVQKMGSRLFPREVPRHTVPEDDLEDELERFRQACSRAAEELGELVDNVEDEVGQREADLLRPQVFMAEDPAFVSEVEEFILENQANAEAAVADVIEKYEKMMSSIDDSYLRERSTDISDAGRRILGHLLFTDGHMAPRLLEPRIVASEQLVPSLTVHLDRENILGFVTEEGGYTSHAAILARSLGIPAVTCLEDITDKVVDGQMMVVDGMEGRVIVDPPKDTLRRYRRQADKFWKRRERVIEQARRPSVTADGSDITVRANIGRLEEAERASDFHAEGVGLFRTEFEYLSQATLPAEEELTERYTAVVESCPQDGVVFRVLDAGGDKYPPALSLAHEENPFLGLRGVRLFLRHVEDVALPQLRAIIRAARKGHVRILYPMVAGMDELEAVLDVAERARSEVARRENCEPPEVEHGVMVEVPSAVHLLPDLLKAVDFASVGTNDLVQYALAADRNSERMADSYDPFHPAVIRILDQILQAGEETGKPVSICGESAADTHFLPILLGLGYHNLSVNVGSVPFVKRAVRQVSLEDCRELADEVLEAKTCGRIHELADAFYERHLENEK